MSSRPALYTAGRGAQSRVVPFPIERRAPAAPSSNAELTAALERVEARLASAIRHSQDRTAIAFEELALALAEHRTALTDGRDRRNGLPTVIAVAILLMALVPNAALELVASALGVLALGYATPLPDALAARFAKGGRHARS